MNLSPSTVSAETVTVIYSGAEIDDSLPPEPLEAVTDWATAAGPGVTRAVEVWAAPWRRLVVSCLATAAAFGGPAYAMYLPVADDLAAGMKAIGVAVRHGQARQSVVNDAELRVTCQGCPIRYI